MTKVFLTFAAVCLSAIALADGGLRLYCRVTQEWWTTEGAAVGVYLFADENTHNAAWPGERMMPVEGQDGLWFVDTDPTVYTSVIFTRVNGSGDIADWGAKTADLALPTDSNNLYTITSAEAIWGDPGVSGEWSRYNNNAGGGGETISSYTLVGDSALCGGKAWDVTNTETDLIPQGDYNYVYTIGSVHLTAYKNYEYKIVANHSWDVSQYPVDGNYTIHVTRSGYYSVQFTFNVDGGAAATPTLLTADEGSQTSEKYSNYALLINEERMVTCAYAGVNDANWAQYVAHVQLSAGESFRIINRVGSDYQIAPTLEQYGEYTNFTSSSDGYYTCSVSGCYDVFYKMNNSLYIGGGSESCSAGVPYDGTSMATATVNITVTNESGNWQGSVAINGEKGGDNGRSGTYLLGSTITVEAFPGTMFQFLRWSDGVLYNPREIVVTGDMTIHADMGETLNYMYGVLINNSLFVRSTWQENGENTVRAQVEQGDTIQLMFTGYAYGLQRRIWMYDLDPYTESGLFTGGAETGYLVCQRSGCYDIYIKENNENNSVFIAQGTVCSRGQNVDEIALSTLPGYYIHGNDSIFGAWDYNKGVYMESYNMQFWLDAGIHEIYVSKVSYGSEAATISSSCSSTSLFTMNNHKTFYMSQPGNLYVSISDGSVCLNGDFSWVYSLVGDSVLFGSAWNLNDFSTEMTWVGENMCNYSLDSVALEAGDYEYKVISNHVWEAGSYPADGNYTIHIETSGVYQILFDFIPGSGCSATPNYIHAIQGDQPCGIVASGECGANGANVTWLLTCDSILTIGGDGRMADYNEETTIAPWYQYREAYNSVYIAAGVLNVGDLAFRQSPNLRYVDLASTVVSLGNYSFYDCPNLHTLTLPESVTTLSDNTPFGGTTTMTNPVYNSNVFVRLPEDYAGEYTVAEGTTVIASQAFKGCNQLTSLVLPNTVHILSGSSIFENCTMLVSVNIPEGVTALGEFTFSNCSSLKAIDLPSTLVSLGSYCFGECWMIESITCRATTPPEANGSSLSGVNYMIPIYVPAGTAEIYKAADGWSGFTDYREIEHGGSTPTEAASTPTYPATQVKAIYSPAYQADCDFGEWGSGTIYSQEDFGKKYETNELGYFGLEFTSLNCTNMEYLHFDIWIAEDASVRFVPIWGGEEQGITRNLYAQQWNSVDIPLNEFDAVTDWFNVYQVKIDNAANLTFWIGNAYFYTTLAIAEDSNAPYNITASLLSSSFFGVDLQLNGVDDSGVLTYTILNGEKVLGAITGTSGTSVTKQIGGLDSNTSYQLTIIASDESGNQAEAISIECATLPAPSPAHTPEMSSDSVLSLYSDAYPFAPESLTTYNAGWWEPPFMTIGELAVNDSALFYHSASSGVIGWQFSPIDATDYPFFNMAIYPKTSGTIDFAPIFGDGDALTTEEYLTENYILIGGQWNYISIDLSDKNLTSMWQVTMRNYYSLDGFFVDNVYFSKSKPESNPSSCIVASGTCGADSNNTNIVWMLTCDSVLTIAGNGTMANYYNFFDVPWSAYRNDIKNVCILDGVTSIGKGAFANLFSLLGITIPNSVTNIGERAFESCYNLLSIEIPYGVSSIENSVFSGCNNLSNVIIPSSVINIGNNAFAECSNLSSIAIPDGVTSIDNYAFTSCSGLLSISIPSGVRSISIQVFSGCSSLTDVTIPDGVTSIGEAAFSHCSSLTNITIPESVTRIDYAAFTGCSSLTSVTIPSSVTSIEGEVFSACSSLTNVNIPNSVTSIGGSAFYGCSNLTSVDIPGSVVSIGNAAFEYCSGLTSINIPSSVTSVGKAAFTRCKKLASIEVDSENTKYDSRNNCNAIIETSTNGLIAGCQNTIIPNDIISIDSCAFQGCESLTNIEIPHSVITLGDAAFKECSGLTSVVIPSSVVSMGKSVFSSCTNIKSIELSSNITKIEESAFNACSSLLSITIPNGVTSIGKEAFLFNSNLANVSIPSSVTNIEESAFALCSKMTSFTCYSETPPTLSFDVFGEMPFSTCALYVPAESVELYQTTEGWTDFTQIRAIGSACFVASGNCGAQGDNVTWLLDCDSILTISGTGAMENYSVNSNGQAPWAEYGLDIRDIVIEEGVRTIGAYAFYNAGSYTNGAYNNVRSVSIPSTVTKLQNNYFYQCPVQTVTLNSDSIVGQTSYSSSASLHKMFGAQVEQYIIGDSVKSIANSAFYNQSADSIRSILLPEGLTSIGSWAFGYLENLDSITLPSSLQSIGSDAFYGSGLRAVTIPGSVTNMGGQAFQNCDKLTSVTLEEGLTSLGTSAFQNCTALTQITIPESMVTISSGAFTDCTHLTKMTVLSAEWVGADKSSSSTTKLAIGNYIRELILGDNIPTIGKYAFSSLDSLRTVTLPSNLTSVSNYAFSSCSSLTSVTCNALTPPAAQSNTFSRQDTLFIPCASKQLYKQADCWKNFGKIRCIGGGDEYDEATYNLTHDWTFIMLPAVFGMEAGDLITEGDVEWGTYNGDTRAMGRSGWENRSASDVYMSSQALIVRAAGTSAKLTISVPEQAQAMSTVSVPVTLHPASLQQNANWCFVGNPYPYGYLLSGLAAQGIESPIHVWNGTGYSTYTPGIDDYIIPPFGAFFIQLPEDSEMTSIEFSAMYIYM